MGSAYPDLDRILAMPQLAWNEQPGPPSPLLQSWIDRGLWQSQISTLSRLEHAPPETGVWGDIGVGEGKFLVGMLAPALVGAKRPVVLTTPDLLRQSRSETEKFLQIFPEAAGSLPTYVPYSLLSHHKRSNMLYQLSPDLVVADEAHSLLSMGSARTQRLIRYFLDNPTSRFVVLSGTLAEKDIVRLWHLTELALRDSSFLPRDLSVVEAWSLVLNHKAEPSAEQRKVLTPLRQWAGERRIEKAYRKRYVTSPQVVVTPTTTVRNSLQLKLWRPEVPPKVSEALRLLKEQWILPDGEMLVDSLEISRHRATLDLGFWYKMIWPEDGELVEAWKQARRQWGAAIRLQVERLQWPGLDSPARVEQAAMAGKAAKSVCDAWAAWAEIRDEVEPESVVVWLDDSLVRGAARHLKAQPGGVLWYSSARAVEPILLEEGLPVYGAGSDHPPASVGHAACSIRAHGTGKNMQDWSYSLVLEPPSSAKPWEQLLGRMHRHGQLEDTVTYEIYAATASARARIYSARFEADAIADKYGKTYKMTFCSWIP